MGDVLEMPKRSQPTKESELPSLKKTTFRIREDYLSIFSSSIKRLGLRRDAYLNHVLREEIHLLKETVGNSERGEALLKLKGACEGVPRQKVGVTLGEDLIHEINEVCEEKRVPRDLFFEHALKFLCLGEGHVPSSLDIAEDMIQNPREEFRIQASDDFTPYGDLIFSDDYVDRMLLQIEGDTD